MDTINSRRRVMLRGAVATGCALGMPLLFGCGREQEEVSRAPQGSPSVAAEGASSVPAEAKVSQADVGYQGTPNGGEQCSNCMHFVAGSNECQLVEGRVSPEGWCTLWVKSA